MLLLLPVLLPAAAATLQVGPDKAYATPCDAAAVAQDGDTIDIDADVYKGDVCAWTADGLLIRGVGGYASLDADGQASQGKAIWVIQGDDTQIEWVEFYGARVPDQNGAGIRQEGANLTVANCWFHDNENGILAGDNTDSDILVSHSLFHDNGYGDGQSHNIYINHVRSFTFEFSYSHHSVVGHQLKSRAAETWVLYSVLEDGDDGQGSYQINLPNGGLAVVLGNVIGQATTAENGGMLSFAEEGATNEQQALYVVNNTFVNDRGSGTFVRNAGKSDAVVTNNLFVGGGAAVDGPAASTTNLETDTPGFVDSDDYHLLATSPAVDAGSEPGAVDGYALSPEWMPGVAGEGHRPTVGALDIGAYEYGEADGGDSGGAGDGGGDGGGDDVSSGACGCSTSGHQGLGWLVALVGAAVVRRRRNNRNRGRSMHVDI